MLHHLLHYARKFIIPLNQWGISMASSNDKHRINWQWIVQFCNLGVDFRQHILQFRTHVLCLFLGRFIVTCAQWEHLSNSTFQFFCIMRAAPQVRDQPRKLCPDEINLLIFRLQVRIIQHMSAIKKKSTRQEKMEVNSGVQTILSCTSLIVRERASSSVETEITLHDSSEYLFRIEASSIRELVLPLSFKTETNFWYMLLGCTPYSGPNAIYKNINVKQSNVNRFLLFYL